MRHLKAIDHFPENLKDTIEPWVLDFEHYRLGALFDNVAGEGDDKTTMVMLESMHKHLLDIQLMIFNWSISGQSELSQELTKSLQILLNLADSTSGASNFVSNFVELDLINQQASLENLARDLDSQ